MHPNNFEYSEWYYFLHCVERDNTKKNISMCAIGPKTHRDKNYLALV
jgi:hypothetical protein